MVTNFKKLMREQVEERLKCFVDFSKGSVPAIGWIRTMRQVLGISSYVLADRIGCSASNISMMEKREKKGTISLEVLEQAARAMNCKLVYAFVPIEPFDQLLEKQARIIAKKKITLINHSMKLEEQGLNLKQLKQQEDDLVQELLKGDLKKIWNDDEV